MRHVLLVVVIAGSALAGPPKKALSNKTADQGGTRYKCPVDKPQKVYGHAVNAKVVLEKDETWTPDNVYLVFGPFHVKSTLTIQAGTVVCLEYGPPGVEGSSAPPPGSISMEPGGALKALGTADRHVVFTALGGPTTYWGGFYYSSGAKNEVSTMQYVDVYNAGLSAANGALNTFPDPRAPPLDFRNVVFYSLQRVGLKNLTSGFTPESRVRVNNYAEETEKRDLYSGYPVLRVHAFAAATITADTLRVGDIPKPARFIQLDSPDTGLESDVTLHRLSDGLVWRTSPTMKMDGPSDDPAVLRIDPGTTVALNNGGYLHIGYPGNGKANIIAVGTPEQPIVFTSDAFVDGREPQRGDAPGIVFQPAAFDPKVSRLEYVTFEFGGGTGKGTFYNCNDNRSDRFAQVMFETSVTGRDYQGPVIKNALFRMSGGAGVRARCNVRHSGGCLLTNYEDRALGNRFEDVDDDHPATIPLTCPE